MEKNTPGFNKIVGKTVSFVDTTSINVVHIHFTDGSIVSVDAEQSHYQIPVINAENDYQE